MYLNFRSLSTLILFCTTIFAGQSIHYDLASVNDNSVTLDFQLKRPCSSKEIFFAFTSQPQTGFQINIVIRNGLSGKPLGVSVKTLTAGWSGKYWQQWCSFNPCAVSSFDSIEGNIVIKFDAPIYKGVNTSDITFKNNCLFVKASLPVAKTAVQIPTLPFKSGIRLEVTTDGIYEITADKLKSLGVPVDRIESSTYRLFEKGHEIPIYITNSHKQNLGPDDRIMFYGKHLSGSTTYFTQFSNTNVYWLTWGTAAGARYAEVSGERRKDPTRYTSSGWIRASDFADTVHLENDNYILNLGDLSDRPPEEITDPPGADTITDIWYWGKIGNTELTTYQLNIPAPAASGSARLIISMMGTTKVDSIPNDHLIRILFNNNPLGKRDSAVWDGKRGFIFESDTFQVSRIKDDQKNTISFLTPDRGFRDYCDLNWIKLIYSRNYHSLNDSITFKSSPNATGKVIEYEITGFKSDQLELWDINRNRYFVNFIRNPGSGTDRGSYSLVFQDSINYQTAYVAQSVSHRLQPSLMVLDTIKNNWEQLSGTEYLIISIDDFRTEFEPLLTMHKEQGLSTAFIDINDIYNRFSYGIRDPESIRTFLKYLFSISGKNPPRFLLLGGDTTHDLDKGNRSRNIVPTHLSRIPGWGPGADDGYFGTVWGEDNFPDLCLGRFPVQNREELKTLVEKTVNYSSKPERGFWRDNMLLLAGGDKHEPDFSLFNDEAAYEIIGSKMNISRIDAYPDSRFYTDGYTAPSKIANSINSGVFLINFTGHGGGNIWSDNGFFSFKDFPKLYNGQWGNGGKLPIIFSFTCLTGFFESNTYRSLGEEFIRTNKNGAICFYGASAYTSRNGNLLMDKLLLETAMDGDFQTIGELLNFGEMSMLVRYGSQYLNLVRQYNLLGDPALPWQITPDTLKLSLSHTSLKQGESLVVNGITDPVRGGNVKLMVKSGYEVWDQSIDSVHNSSISHSFAIKDKASTSSGLVRAYAWNDSSEVRGWAMFAKDTIMVYDVELSPEKPSFGDSVLVSCKLAAASDALIQMLYAFAPAVKPNVSFSSITMIKDSTGGWISPEKIYLRNAGDISERLLIKFRTFPAEEAPKESSIYSFGIRGRPDLVFTNNSLTLQWIDDSLSIAYQVLNIGNAASPPFQTLLQWSNHGSISDTIAAIKYSDSLAPGEVQSFFVAIADTQGNLQFTAYLNNKNEFLEILDENNRIWGQTHLRYANLKNTTDSLTSQLGGLSIVPARNFNKNYRVFLFDNPVKEPVPLQTSSKWVNLNLDSLSQVSIGCRPSLMSSDSLDWLFRPDTASLHSGLTKSSASDIGKLSVMIFDTVLARWRYAGGDLNAAGDLCKNRTGLTGSFALASLYDSRPPDIEISVYGRTLNFLDYAAKNKPFSIMLSDPSEIYPPSVHITLNRRKLPADSRSSIPSSGDLKNILITAYPDPQRSVDSMTIELQDLAGNLASRTYAYMPGEDLSIKFLSCHPNPFTAQTMANGNIRKVRFAFLITDVADKITMTIYTVSGRKIRSWTLRSLIGYQELEWDGRDKDGFRIANGTYYAKLTAQNSDRKVKKILRIAKLEGY